MEPALKALLNELNLLEFSKTFEDEGVLSMRYLLALEPDDLKELVPKLGPRRLLEKELEKLKMGFAPRAPSVQPFVEQAFDRGEKDPVFENHEPKAADNRLSTFNDDSLDNLLADSQSFELDESSLPVNVWGEDVPARARSFGDMDLPQFVLQNLSAMKWQLPTVIQQHTTPSLSAFRNVLGCAQTGSGKTGAFLVPMIKWLAENPGQNSATRALVLLPTRELAQQVYTESRKLTNNSPLRQAVVFGNGSVPAQREALRSNPDIVIGTPGRTIMFCSRGALDLSNLKFLILDEADRMLDDGFAQDIQNIIETSLPPRANYCIGMFSAVLDNSIVDLAKKYVEQEIFFIVGEVGKHSTIEQSILLTSGIAHKQAELAKIIEETKGPVLVFCSTKRMCDTLGSKYGQIATILHGDLSQYVRELALMDFKKHVRRVLIATDVAARGIDVPGIELVVNFDLPSSMDCFVHRVGRTGRAGHKGKAVSFFDPKTDAKLRPHLAKLLQDAQQPIPDFIQGEMSQQVDWHSKFRGSDGRRPARGGYSYQNEARFERHPRSSSDAWTGAWGEPEASTKNRPDDGSSWGQADGWGNTAGNTETPSGWGQAETEGWGPNSGKNSAEQCQASDPQPTSSSWGSGW
eukprot:TRINITY_DN5166_c0_g1_i1.p1 TRINITY_DN5166_c0_g1~~TRINITY_DN5166_c0_g1_i1.p1  ORF type:complete len:633 (-),score=79.08 TRINITY_DN5166_c0_g1_i1:34-1932(-)